MKDLAKYRDSIGTEFLQVDLFGSRIAFFRQSKEVISAHSFYWCFFTFEINHSLLAHLKHLDGPVRQSHIKAIQQRHLIRESGNLAR